MIQNKLKIKFFLLTLLFLNLNTHIFSEIIILNRCNNSKDGFLKNEYILDLEKSLMTRKYIYDSKTYKKYRIIDLSVKKENIIQRFIYEEEDLILTDQIGYQQFYTQLVFERNNPIIKIKTLINNE